MTSEYTPKKRKGGRPKKSEETRFSNAFSVRVTSEQARAFRERAERRGLSPTALLRKFMTGRTEALDELVIGLDDIALLRKKCGEISVVQDRIKRLALREERTDLGGLAEELEQELEGVRSLIKRLEPKGGKR
jgi:hypothetical protein